MRIIQYGDSTSYCEINMIETDNDSFLYEYKKKTNFQLGNGFQVELPSLLPIPDLPKMLQMLAG